MLKKAFYPAWNRTTDEIIDMAKAIFPSRLILPSKSEIQIGMAFEHVVSTGSGLFVEEFMDSRIMSIPSIKNAVIFTEKVRAEAQRSD